MSSKKKKMDTITLLTEDTTLINLKERYFRLYAREIASKTKELARQLDELEITINKRKEELLK
jgi:hypothetical protein